MVLNVGPTMYQTQSYVPAVLGKQMAFDTNWENLHEIQT